jgi:cytochrome c556
MMKLWHGAVIGLFALGVAGCGGEEAAVSESEDAAAGEGEEMAVAEAGGDAVVPESEEAVAEDEESVASGEEEYVLDAAVAAEAIETRQQNMKDLGAAFKAISDQIRSGAPDTPEIQLAAATVTRVAGQDLASWFPRGSGMGSGFETDALDAIWADPDGFAEAVGRLKTAAPQLNDAAQSGDAASMGEAFQAAGGACRNCHEKFRLDDN